MIKKEKRLVKVRESVRICTGKSSVFRGHIARFSVLEVKGR